MPIVRTGIRSVREIRLSVMRQTPLVAGHQISQPQIAPSPENLQTLVGRPNSIRAVRFRSQRGNVGNTRLLASNNVYQHVLVTGARLTLEPEAIRSHNPVERDIQVQNVPSQIIPLKLVRTRLFHHNLPEYRGERTRRSKRHMPRVSERSQLCGVRLNPDRHGTFLRY